MIRVLKTKFLTSKEDLERLFNCNRISAQIWNDCLDHAKEYHQQTGHWISKSALHLATKGKYPIHSQSIQAVFEKYLEARENANTARQMGYSQIRYPYKEKKHFNTKWKKDGFRILDQGRIELSETKRTPEENGQMSKRFPPMEKVSQSVKLYPG